MATFYTFLLFVSYTALVVQGLTLRIGREERYPDDDIFLPENTAECPNNLGKFVPNCDKYNADRLSGCWCSCQDTVGHHTFFEANYSCIEASIARQQAGCDLLFTDETVDGLLKFFPAKNIRQKTINVPVNQICSFFFGDKIHAQYLGCAGTWNEIPTQSVNDSLEVTPDWSASRLQMRTKDGGTFFQNNAGHIVRLAVQCHHRDSNILARSTCVMFKVEGKNRLCPISQPSPLTPSATLPPPTAGGINATYPPWTDPTKVPTTASEVPLTTEATPGGETTQSTEKVEADAGTRKASKKNTFIIAGAVAGGILLIALILLILWRCNNPKKRDNPHRRFQGSASSISRPISQMGRNSIPVYTDAAHLAPMGVYSMRTNSMDNPAYRRGSDGIILGPDFKRGSIYSDNLYPTSAPPRPPTGKRASMNGHVNPGLSLREDIVTMNPLYEGQMVEHKDLEALNCSDFGVHPDQIVLEERKNPEMFDETYDCPEEILKGKNMTSTPVPVYYVVDDTYPDTYPDSYPDSISNTFRNGANHRGRPDGHVYDEPEADLSRRPYVVMDNPNAVAYRNEFDEPPRDDELLNMRRTSPPNHGILKVGSTSPNGQRHHSQADYDDGHMQII